MNKFATLTIASLFGTTALVGCGHGTLQTEKKDSEVKVDGVISVYSAWVKDKGKKFDVRVNMVNLDQNKGMLVMLRDMSCKRGDVVGTLRYTFYNTGERAIDFKPGQTKQFNMVCDLPSVVTGPFQISIAKVYANPNMDGYTQGPVLANNVVWKLSDSAK